MHLGWFGRQVLAGSLSGLILLAGSISAFAQDEASRISGISVNADGDIVLQVNGEGFDPLVRIEPSNKPGMVQIVVAGDNVGLDPTVQRNINTFSQALAGRVPAIEAVNFFQERKTPGSGMRIVFESWQMLKPQVRSNKGNIIVIALVGDHSLPPGRQAERTAKAQTQSSQASSASNATVAKKGSASPTDGVMDIPDAVASPKITLKPAPRNRSLSWLPEMEAVAKDPSWQPGYRHVKVDTTSVKRSSVDQEGLAQAVAAAQNMTPKMLAQDTLPVDVPVDDGAPTEPIRLKATPPGFQPTDESTWDHPPNPGRVYQTLPSIQRGDQSFYAALSENTSPAVKQAWQQVLSGDRTGAELFLRNYLEKSPTDAAVRYLLAQILLRPVIEGAANAESVKTQELCRETARQELLKIVAQKSFLPAYTALMSMYLEDGNDADAGRLWDKFNGQYQDASETWFLKGRLNEALSDWPGARDAYTKALALSADNVEAHYRLAQVEAKASRLDAARWELQEALRLSPEDGRLWKLLGYVAQKQDNVQQAERFYRKAGQPDALINLGRLLETRNQPEKALTLYAAAEQLAGDDPDFLYNLGLLYAGMQQKDRAAKMLTHFLELESNASDERVTKAKSTLKQLGRKAGSSANRDKILPF
jgi:tetratricopeptide (TPR) repeat protein